MLLLLPATALFLQSCLPGGMTLPQSPALKWLERKSGRVAYVALDGNVRTADQAGGAQKDVTTDAAVSEDGSGESFFYQFPAWSPDGRSLAFVGVRRTADTIMNTGIWAGPADRRPPARVFAGDDKMPKYLSWSPDSSRLVFVSTLGANQQQLNTVAAGGGMVRILREGMAFTWRWKRGAAALAVHSVKLAAGALEERVSILDSQGVMGDEDLPPIPGEFEAPAWSADGRGIIMAVQENAGSTLYLEDRSGADGRLLARVGGDMTFEISPDGSRLAWAARRAPGGEGDRRLFVMNIAGSRGSPLPLTGDEAVSAFFWSPDSSKIAFFVPSPGTSDAGSAARMTLKVLRVKTGAVRTVATFQPSPYFLGLLLEYGQYAESARLWSPDSRFLLYCSMQPDSFDIMVAYAEEPIAPRKIADGLMATWSPH